jgi:hypothetical protein
MPFNPFDAWPITGTWADHMSYSAGGEDYPTPYGYVFPAPASGILRSSGGSGEWAAGWIGSAGRRSILSLDTPIRDLTAIVFQHQAIFGREGHYAEGDPGCGTTGASANGSDWGGDVHMHWHGLNANGSRLCMSNYVTGADPGTGTSNSEDWFMSWNFMGGAGDASGVWIIGPKGFRQIDGQEYDLLRRYRMLRVDPATGALIEAPGGVSMSQAEMQIVANTLAGIE